MSWKQLPWIVIALLAAAGCYGFLHERLWAQTMWSPAGGVRFLAYAAVFWSVAGVILLLAPRWMWAIGAAALLYTAWWTGPVAPLCVLYFLGSCFCLGRLMIRDADLHTATLLGAAMWMSAIWVALHFAVNTRGVYAAAFLLPYVFGYRFLRPAGWKIPEERREAAAFATLLFVLIAHLLAALKPEVSADGLSMHLALPMAVARDARWAFDFRLNTWALMPNGADSLFAALYLLGGEAAARLLNFAFLAVICVLVARTARRWVSPAECWLVAALFASTPLVQLVTGSLFVENVWGAFIVGATLALTNFLESPRSRDLFLTAIFTGAALACKLVAGGFAAPIIGIAAFAVVGKRHWRSALVAGGLLILFGAPPYAYAFAKTGNPIFPFANHLFQSPDYDTAKSFTDPRFTAALSWKTPYEMTFRSRLFLEAQGGAAGFQYFLLFLPAILFARRKDQWVIAAVTIAGSVVVLAPTPDLRYLYPALPLASLPIAWLMGKAPGIQGSAGLLILIALNMWFLPSSGWYNGDFALFRHADIQPYVERTAPVRPLIADLNRLAPGQPAAFFSTDETGGLNGPAYTDSWHSERYWTRILKAGEPRKIAEVLDSMGVHYVVASASRRENPPPVELFLRLWLEPLRTVGTLGLFRIRDVHAPPDTNPFAPGRRYEDIEERIVYEGSWLHDLQFPESSDRSLTYSETPGNSFRIAFSGTAITYVFTKALNRGIADVRIDGRSEARINQYSPQTMWQSAMRFGSLKPGPHVLDVRVTGEKDARSAGIFVDLDAFEVEP